MKKKLNKSEWDGKMETPSLSIPTNSASMFCVLCVCVSIMTFCGIFAGFTYTYFDSKIRTLRTLYSYQWNLNYKHINNNMPSNYREPCTKHQTIWQLIKIKTIMRTSARIRIQIFYGCDQLCINGMWYMVYGV